MPAYWIARSRVTDPESYMRYAKGVPEAFAKYGAKILVRGGAAHPIEGDTRERNVVIEFPSVQHALDAYNSDTYQALKKHREGAGEVDIVIVEGI